GTVRTGTPAVIHIEAGEGRAVASGDGRGRAGAGVSAVPWFAVGDLFEGDRSALEPVVARARAMDSSPIVTVNLWFDRPLLAEPFVGLPGRAMQWVFDKRSVLGGDASHLSVVSSGASPLVALTNQDLIRTAHEELLDAL